MKMRDLVVAVASLCIASVAMADLTRVNVVMDISDPDNVTLTNYEENGTYGGAYFAIDGLEFQGDVAEVNLTGPRPMVYPEYPWGIGIARADGDIIFLLATSTAWMEYGIIGNFGALVKSSDPDDFYCIDPADGCVYPRSFLIADADQQNGLGGAKLLGTIVPEPASMSLLAVGALAIIRRRRL